MTVERSIIVGLIVALVLVALLLIRQRRATTVTNPKNHTDGARGSDQEGAARPRISVVEFPETGLLVPDDLDQASFGRDALAALRSLTVPVAVQYEQITLGKADKLRGSSILLRDSSSVVRSLAQITQGLDLRAGPGGEVLYRVVLPRGQELASAVGGGYRGFSRGASGINASAKLFPVGKTGLVGGLAAAGPVGWGLLAVAASTMVLDGMAKKEERAFRQRMDEFMARSEERYRSDKIADIKAISSMLDREIAHLLDGDPADPRYVNAYQDAEKLLAMSSDLAQRWRAELKKVIKYESQGDSEKWTANHGEIRRALSIVGGQDEQFFFDLAVAQATIPIGQKAVVAYAADVALRDSSNPYEHLQKSLRAQGLRVNELESDLNAVVTDLNRVKLYGSGHLTNHAELLELNLHNRLEGQPAHKPEAKPLAILQSADGTMTQVETDALDRQQDGGV